MELLKKAQIETLGLVVIIIILAFALIFALQFILKNDSSKLNERYLQLNADNLRNTVLKTTINGNRIKDEIVFCNNNQNCDELNLIIKEIIESSIKNNYEFNAGVIEVKKGKCSNKNILTSSIQPIALTEIKVSLKLC